ncbi:MAG: hypothetical protein GKR95_20980 [Gammaproteobacteria bacterium]|nr:hypothetical protein [Gammaproteobacteria bacterium]
MDVLILVSEQTRKYVHELIAESSHRFEIQTIDSNTVPIQDSKAGKIGGIFRELSYTFSEFKSRYLRSLFVLKRYPNTVLITYDDRMPSLISVLKAAYKLKIPVFLPSILTATPDRRTQTSNVLQEQRMVEKLLVPMTRLLCKNQINNDGRLYYSPMSFLTLLFNGCLPQNPWAKGTQRFISRLGVEAAYIRDMLLNFGVPTERIVVTGLPIYDFMDFSLIGPHSDEQVLLLALPQYAEHGAMGLEGAMPIIRDILQGLKTFEGRVVVSLHPRMIRENYEPEITRFGYECATENVEFWLRRCSIFIAANTSSTIYWALMLGIRTLLLNQTYPKSDLFRHFESLQYIEESPSRELPDFVANPMVNWNKLMLEDQQKLSKELVSDGNCGKRNVEIIHTLLSSP